MQSVPFMNWFQFRVLGQPFSLCSDGLFGAVFTVVLDLEAFYKKMLKNDLGEVRSAALTRRSRVF